MGYSVFPAPAAGSKTMYRTTLTSGTSYTVPAGVTYLNVTLVGGGGGGGGCSTSGGTNPSYGSDGGTTTFTGATSAPGGTGGVRFYGNTGNTAQTGVNAPSSSGLGGSGAGGTGVGGTNAQFGINGVIVSSTLSVTPGASISYSIGAGGAGGSGGDSGRPGGNGGSGRIDVEYWV
jgi:hypothetical protein